MTATAKRADAGRRLRLVVVAALIAVLAACSSDGSRPSISATLPPDASIARPAQPTDTDAAAPPPAETAAPETQPEPTAAPETQPPQQPEETAAAGAEPSDTVAPADDGGSTLWWPWVLAALLIILAIVAIARRRRPPTSSSGQLQANTLLDEIDQLTIHLAALTPDGLRAVAQSDAMRLATMRATLGTVIATAPNPANQAALNRLSTPMATLHGAIDSIAMAADPSAPGLADSVAQLATQLHTASASVRAELALHQ